MKKIFALILVCVIAFIVVPRSCAANPEETDLQASQTTAEEEGPKRITNEQYGYTYTKEIGRRLEVIRTYVNPETENENQTQQFSAQQLERTRAVLKSLGNSEEVLSRLTDADLRKYASAKSITTVTSYMTRNAFGRVIPITEGNACAELHISPFPEQNHIGDGSGGDAPIYRERDNFDIIRIVLSIYHLGGSRYEITAEMNTTSVDELERLQDCFGIAYSCGTVAFATRKGWTVATMKEVDANGGVTYQSVTTNYSEYDTTFGIYGNWEGVGIEFEMPIDGLNSPPDVISTLYQYTAFVSTEMGITYPSLPWDFNVSARYDRETASHGIDLSMSMGAGGLGVSFGFSTATDVESYITLTDDYIHYSP